MFIYVLEQDWMAIGRVSMLSRGEVLVNSHNCGLERREILNSRVLYPGFLLKPQRMHPVASFINHLKTGYLLYLYNLNI